MPINPFSRDTGLSTKHSLSLPGFPILWILWCAYLNAGGWLLSALGELNVIGYLALLLAGVPGSVLVLRAETIAARPVAWVRLRRRFTRLLPLSFLMLGSLAILGGVIHPPNNYDALAYRLPRILHWLAEGHWHWIPTEFQRLNTRAPGYEWVAAPIMLLSRTDRLLFLINAISLLLLPGRVFAVFIRLGVPVRAAWAWMWILPSGYCFLLQAGGIGNDLFGALLAMLAFEFALRSHMSAGAAATFIALMAAGVMTAGKTNNLTLGLGFLIVIWKPVLRVLHRHPLRLAGVLVFAAASSFLPIASLNLKYGGDWTGTASEQLVWATSGHPFFRVAFNSLLLVIQNFVPPVFPLAAKWSAWAPQMVPAELQKVLDVTFERGRWSIGEMQVEEGAGLGMGLCVLLVLSWGAAFSFAQSQPGAPSRRFEVSRRVSMLVPSACLIGLLVYFAKSGFTSVARLSTPYYLLCIPLLLQAPGHSVLVRKHWWRGLAVAVFTLAAVVLVIQPSRPLWPAKTVLRFLQERQPNPLQHRALTVYEVYSERNSGFAPLRAALSPEVKVLGLVTADDPEASLWKPYGTLRPKHVTSLDSAASLRARGIEWIAINPQILESRFGMSVRDWYRKLNGEVVGEVPMTLRASTGEVRWSLVRLR